MSDLVIGGLAAWLFIYSSRFNAFFEKLPKTMIYFFYILGIGSIILNHYFPIIERYRIILPIFWAFIILEQSLSHQSIFKFSQSKWLSKLGKISYGCYMYHGVIMVLTSSVLFNKWEILNEFGNLSKIGLMLINFILTLIVSHVSFHYFEMYFLKYKNKLNHSN